MDNIIDIITNKLRRIPRKVIISIIALLLVALVAIITVSIINTIKENSLNPGGTGGGYIPDGFVSLKGVEPDFQLSNEDTASIRIGIESYLHDHDHEAESYTATIDPETWSNTYMDTYKLSSFNITINDDVTYKVLYAVDFINNWREAIITSEDGVYNYNDTKIEGAEGVLRQGIPTYILDRIVHGIGDNIIGTKTITFSEPKISTSPESSMRIAKMDIEVNNETFLMSVNFSYDISNPGTAELSSSSGKKYTFTTEHSHD